MPTQVAFTWKFMQDRVIWKRRGEISTPPVQTYKLKSR